jgi:hypothetical protein
LECLAAHANEDFLVGRNVLRIEVPVTPASLNGSGCAAAVPMAKGDPSNKAANIAIFMDNLPVEQNCFVGLTIGRHQLAGLCERLGMAGFTLAL